MIRSIWKSMGIIAVLLLLGGLFPIGVLANRPADDLFFSVQPVNDSSDTKKNGFTFNSLPSLPLVCENTAIDKQIIVVYQAAIADNFQSLGLITSDVIAGKSVSDRVDVLAVRDGVDVDALINTISDRAGVLAAGRNKTIEPALLPNDPDILNGYAWQFSEIGCENTWNLVSNPNPVVVAVIDSGLDVNHPDLIGRTVPGYDYLTSSTQMTDVIGHGTWVSGCITATANNQIGIAGVAGLANVKIAPYRVGNDHFDLANICAAIIAAADRPDVRIINMSYRSYDYEATEAAAIGYAADRGKILVASAGNEGNDPNYSSFYAYPGSYDSVISVAATTSSHIRADFSQYNDRVDLCAPGKDVYSTSAGGGYDFVYGTSFSAPMVAGACGVLLAADPQLTADEVETLLKKTASDLGNTGYDPYYGYGLIQLDQALSGLDPVPPTSEVACVYQGHIQNIGWQDWKSNGEICGTSGQSLRMEGLRIKTDAEAYDLGIEYQSHIQNIGWQTNRYDGEISGTTGQSLRLEAIRVMLTGANAEQFDIYYRVHAQNIGWMDWAKNGENSGTAGFGYRLEAVEIKILDKGADPPGDTARPFVQKLY